MVKSLLAIEALLQRNLDESTHVERLEDAQLSAFLRSSFEIHSAEVLGEDLTIATPTPAIDDLRSILKRSQALQSSLGKEIVLHLDRVSRPERRDLLASGQAFVTERGDFYLPSIALSFSSTAASRLRTERPFNSTQQSVFLYCLYADEKVLEQKVVRERLGVSTGSISNAFSLFTKLGMLDYTIGGKTGRKRLYHISDRKRFFEIGMQHFGSPLRESMIIPYDLKEDDWLHSGLSALSKRSDLTPPDRPVFAAPPSAASRLKLASHEATELCEVQILKYDPSLFSDAGVVDPLTMVLTIDEEDERISIAFRKAMAEYEWYTD